MISLNSNFYPVLVIGSFLISSMSCIKKVKSEALVRQESKIEVRAFAQSLLNEFNKGQKVNKPSDLIALIPEDLRRHYALVYESRSQKKLPNGRLESEVATFEQPRVIMVSKDGSKMVAVASASFDSEPRLEVIELNETSRDWDFSVLNFNYSVAEQQISATLDTNVKVCSACHGKRLHPIVDTYDMWPGWYGGAQAHQNHSSQIKPLEIERFENVLKPRAESDPILSKLPGLAKADFYTLHSRLVKTTHTIQNQGLRLLASDFRSLLKEHPLRMPLHKALYVASLGEVKRKKLKLQTYDSYLPRDLAIKVTKAASKLHPKVKRSVAEYTNEKIKKSKPFGADSSSKFDSSALEVVVPILALRNEIMGEPASANSHWTMTIGETPSHSFGTGSFGMRCLSFYLEDFSFESILPKERNCASFIYGEEPDEVSKAFADDPKEAPRRFPPLNWPF